MQHFEKALRIEQFCSPFLVMAAPETSLSEINELMEEASIRHIPIVENEKPIGLISQRELLLVMENDMGEKFCAKDLMTEDPFCVYEGTDLRDVVAEMEGNKFGSCLIMNSEQKISGIFTMVDALRTLKILLGQSEGETVRVQSEG